MSRLPTFKFDTKGPVNALNKYISTKDIRAAGRGWCHSLGGIFSAPTITQYLSLLVIIASYFVCIPSAHAATYYIDTVGGSDSNNGLATTTAWQTVAKVNTRTFIAGDMVLFKRGQTATGSITLYNDSGAAGNPIIFGAYGTGTDPAINSAGQSRTFDIENSASYITVQNLQLYGASEAAVYISTGTFSNLVFQNLDIASTSAFKLFSTAAGITTNTTFDHITVHDAARGFDHRGSSINDTYQDITINGTVDYGIVYTLTTGTSTVYMNTVNISTTTLDAIRLKNIANSTFNNIAVTNTVIGLNFQQGVDTATVTSATIASSSQYGLWFGGALNHVYISNTNTSRSGIDGISFATTLKKDVTISHATSTYNSNDGVSVHGAAGSSFIIADSFFANNTLNGLTLYDNLSAHVLRTTAAHNSNDGFNIRNNANVNFIQCTAQENGINGSGADGDGFSWHDGSTGSLSRSLAKDNKKSGVTNIGTTSVQVFSNVFAHSSSSTLPMVYMSQSAQSVTYNNTFINLSREAIAIGRNTLASSTIVNNLVYGFKIGIDASSSYDTLSHNFVFNALTPFSGYMPDVGSSSTTDPMLIDVAGGNYRPHSNSPVAGAGSSLYCPSTDYDGVVFGPLCSIGAFTVVSVSAGDNSELRSGGGRCVNCTTAATPASNSNRSASTEGTTSPPATASSSQTITSSSTPLLCVQTETLSNSLSTAGLVNFLVSLAIIPSDKAAIACAQLGATTVSTNAFRFTRSLKTGMHADDVKQLQRFLNTHGFVVTQTGAGAPGGESDYFGTLTFDAVKRFQAVYKDEILAPVGLSVPSGFFGTSSIKKANEMLEKII